MRIHSYDSIPEFEDLGEGIYRVKIPQPFYEDNNIYLIDSGEPILIDTGYVQNLGLLQRALRKLGYSLHSIQKIFYTHDHIDHISAALVMRSYSNARLYGMVGMANHVGDYRDHMRRFQRANNRLIYKSQADQEQRKSLARKSEDSFIRFLDAVEMDHKVDPVLKMDVELQEGDVIPIGERELGFIYTPGHNQWHLTPYLVGEGIYFTGDLVLQNVSAVYAELDGNLGKYQESLDRLLKLPIRRLLPAHFDEPANPQRAIKLLIRTIGILERGVKNRLKEGFIDLRELTIQAMGEKIEGRGHYATALAVMHSFIDKFNREGCIEIKEMDPPYEQYRWKEPV
ncbi:MAG: hydrolase [Spirochaetaceae bacterium]|nr:hydrolase [Spirochaetaceae bacterium]|tara:strand:+ start:107998 stop:109020 length:1023 start_codon:yes stop_codon:yes gene_type:complete